MLDWKILAASFAALLVVSSLLIGGFGKGNGGGIFSDLIKKVNDWLGTSPFTGFITSSAAGPKTVRIILHGEKIEISPDSPINVTVDSLKVRNFKGSVITDFSTLSFKQPSGTEFSIPLSNFTIKDAKINKAVFTGIGFTVDADDLDVSAQNGTIEISDFSGSISFQKNAVFLDGNVSLVRCNHRNII